MGSCHWKRRGKSGGEGLNWFQIKWVSVDRAWREAGLIGLFRLAKRHSKHLLCLPEVHRMAQRHRLADERYDTWIRAAIPDEEKRQAQKERVFSHSVTFLVPTYNTRPDLLHALADSMLAQTCESWQACFYDGHSSSLETIRALREIEEEDERFHVFLGRKNQGIAGNTNRALAMAATDYVALCDHDDLLTPDCVYWFLDAAERGADFIYSDEDKVSEDGGRFYDPHLKADFSPDALRSGNYICHIMGMQTALLQQLGGLREAFDGSQDHDLALRATEMAHAIAHIPRVLYHWRMLNTSYSHASQERCVSAATRAIDDQLGRLSLGGHARVVDLAPRITYDVPGETGITLIILEPEGSFQPAWLRGVLRRTLRGKERIRAIFVAGRDDGKNGPIRGIPVRYVNSLQEAANQAETDLLLFMEHGTRPVWGDWLERLTMFATRPWIACAGGGLVDRKQNYLVCGYALPDAGTVLRRFQGENRFGLTYQNYDKLVREVTAVSASLFMIRRDLFQHLSGFRPYSSDLGAVALGLRAMREGLSNIIVPEAVSQASDDTQLYRPLPKRDLQRFQAEFGGGAPNGGSLEHYYSPHFEREMGCMQVDTDRHEECPTVITVYAN